MCKIKHFLHLYGNNLEAQIIPCMLYKYGVVQIGQLNPNTKIAYTRPQNIAPNENKPLIFIAKVTNTIMEKMKELTAIKIWGCPR